MTSLDYAVLAVLALSALLGLWRGVVREVVSLAGWVAAIVATTLFAAQAAQLIPATFATPAVRSIIAGVAIFLVVLMVASICGLLLSRLLRVAGLGLADRMLGGAFGFARGALICVLFAVAVGLTALPREPFWRDAQVRGPLETAVVAAKPWLPRAVADRVRFER